MAQSMGCTCVIKFLTTNLVDFVSNVKLRLNKNHTLTNLVIVTNISICEIWEMTFLTNILKASYINWDYQCPRATYNHNIKIHGFNIHNSFHYFYFQIRKFSTHKWFKFQHTSKLVGKSWPFVLLLWTSFNLLIVVTSGARIVKMVA
jgi:hypothetical protein